MVLESETSAPNQIDAYDDQPSNRPMRVAHDDRQDHLDGRTEEGDRPHALELLEVELHSQREQQQCHADLGQQLDVVDLGDGDPPVYGPTSTPAMI